MNWIARIFMGLLGLGLLAGLLLALGLYTVFAAVRWLLTGRKPQVVLVWQQFSALRKGARWGQQPGYNGGFESARQGDIVDVEAREVVDDAPRLPPRQ
jgi:predicted lipid-binding transport protein (Tim44 family)